MPIVASQSTKVTQKGSQAAVSICLRSPYQLLSSSGLLLLSDSLITASSATAGRVNWSRGPTPLRFNDVVSCQHGRPNPNRDALPAWNRWSKIVRTRRGRQCQRATIDEWTAICSELPFIRPIPPSITATTESHSELTLASLVTDTGNSGATRAARSPSNGQLRQSHTATTA
jgi:hypothetical protein